MQDDWLPVYSDSKWKLPGAPFPKNFGILMPVLHFTALSHSLLYTDIGGLAFSIRPYNFLLKSGTKWQRNSWQIFQLVWGALAKLQHSMLKALATTPCSCHPCWQAQFYHTRCSLHRASTSPSPCYCNNVERDMTRYNNVETDNNASSRKNVWHR